MSKAAYRIAKTRRPASGQRIGYRIKVAVINEAAWDVSSQMHVQSYAKQYLITQSGDYTDEPDDTLLQGFLRQTAAYYMIDQFLPR